MGLLTRTQKGSKLTIEEMDENLNYLKSLAISSSGPTGPQGIQGPQGTAGASVTILGSYADLAAFNAGAGASPGTNIGDAWLLLSDGSLMSWNGTIWFDAGGIQGPPGAQGPQGPAGVQANLLAVPTNIIPDTDNYYTLGNEDFRWQSVHIGPGTIYITDTVLETDASLTVTNGVLLIDGANQLQVGDLKFVDNTIQSVSGAIDIEIGLTGSTGDLVLNRNTILATGKSLTFGNGSVQTTAYVPPVDTAYAVTFGTTGGTQPTFSGAPLVTGSYVLNGDLVFFRVNVAMSNITNFGTGQYTITLPFINKYDTILSPGHLHDNSPGTDYVIFGEVEAGSNISTLYYQPNNSQLDPFDYNSPKVLQTVDFFHISGTYVKG